MSLSADIKWWLAAVGAAAFVLGSGSGCDKSSEMNESTMNVKHVAQGEFGDEVTHCSLPVVVEFYAVWCGPCRELAPELDNIAGGYTGKIKFVKINVDESPGIAQNYEVQAIPTVIMFKDGKLADRIEGLVSEADLKARVDKLVSAK